MWWTTGRWLTLWLFGNTMLSTASQLTKQKIMQPTEYLPGKKPQPKSAKAFSLLEVNYNFPSKPQGTAKCKGISQMCSSSPKPEMNYPIDLSSKFVDNACFDFQSVYLCSCSEYIYSLVYIYNIRGAFMRSPFVRGVRADTRAAVLRCC